MSSGGARARSGPAPDPNALRRDRDASWTMLPAHRTGKAPKWPLLGAQAHSVVITDEGGVREIVPQWAHDRHKRELALWRSEWRRPQAVMWEREGHELEVALYVRALAAAERGDTKAATRTLVRQYQEELGISKTGMARHGWRLPAGTGDQHAAAATVAAPARSRFKVVTGGAG